jgi:hypothetical protein
MYISFSIIVFLQGVLCIFPLHVHVYIRASGPQMNTSAIHNRALAYEKWAFDLAYVMGRFFLIS